MSGNVWEWQFTSKVGYDVAYDVASVELRRGIRGGSCRDDSSCMTVSFVYSYAPRLIYKDVGFRLARTAK
jgi:formylglycine-generating enzyme required for sulfatase activity